MYLHKGSTSQIFRNFNIMHVSCYVVIPNEVLLLIGVTEAAQKEEGTFLMKRNVHKS